MPRNQTRRVFLQSSAAFAAAAASGTAVPRLAGAEDDSLKVGRNIYKSLKWGMIRTEGTTLDKFKMLKELGFEGVEIDSPDGVDKEEAIQASRETGLPIEGVVNSTHWQVRHSDPDPEVRARALANMQTAMRDAKRVGADSVLLVPGRVTDDENENHDHVWERSIADIRKLIPLAEELQVKILIENVGNGFCTDPKLFAQYMDEIGHPMVGVHFDIGNHIRFSPPAEWIRVLGKRIRKLDVKDRTKGGDQRQIGEGDADWPAVRTALVEIGYRGWAAAEVSGGDKELLEEVLTRMNQVLGKSDGKPAANLPGATK
jgi:hexulose-6-phosphate isomerase